MSAHTPGPWAYSAIDHEVCTKHDYRPGERLAPIVCTVNPDLDEYEANKALITAAPAMLEALKECVRYFDQQFPRMNFGIPEQCRQAIAQAEEAANERQTTS